MSERDALTIRDIERRTGVHASTLRIWEARHGFPEPRRLPSGHRRYSEEDSRIVRRVVELRAGGLSLSVAIDRARGAQTHPEVPIFAALRRERPDLRAHALSKRALVRLSHAIEDECSARPRQRVLVGAFQQRRFYRHDRARWQDMARASDLCLVLLPPAGRRARAPRAASPLEIPSGAWDPAGREWLLVSSAEGSYACLAAWERPGQQTTADGERVFDAVWTLDASAVRVALRSLSGRLAAEWPEPARLLLSHADELGATPVAGLGEASAIMARMLEYLDAYQAPG